MALLRFDPSVAYTGFYSYFYLAPIPVVMLQLKRAANLAVQLADKSHRFFFKYFLRFLNISCVTSQA